MEWVLEKTCSAITIAESYIKSLNKTSNKILVLVETSLIESNFRKEIHDIEKESNQCTFFDYIIYDSLDKDKQKLVDIEIDRKYEIDHFGTLSNTFNNKKNDLYKEEFHKWIKKNYSNRLIIIDEVHNLKYKQATANAKRYDVIKTIIEYSENVKLLLLSGTPMAHEASEIVDILNLLLLNDNRKKDLLDKTNIFGKGGVFKEGGEKKIKNISKGYISYITQKNPKTFPQREYPKNAITVTKYLNNKYPLNLIEQKNEYKLVICQMGQEQTNKYIDLIDLDEKKN